MSEVSKALRSLVTERAGGCCEYCRISQEDRLISFEIDHIIAQKHGGPTEADNLCFSCYQCNGHKGSDLGSIDWAVSGELKPLYNPRKQQWSDHFRLNGARIEPLTSEGRVTVFLLHLNDPDRIEERELLIQLRRYPCSIT